MDLGNEFLKKIFFKICSFHHHHPPPAKWTIFNVFLEFVILFLFYNLVYSAVRQVGS